MGSCISIQRVLFMCLSIFLGACSGSTKDANYSPGISVSLLNSQISTSATTVASGQSITFNVLLRDQNYNSFNSTSPNVEFVLAGGTSSGNLGTVTTTGNGVFTVTYEGLVAGTPNQLYVYVNQQEIQSTSPTIQVYDLTPPPIPSAVLFSSNPTNSRTANLTLSSCAGINSVFVTELALPPTGGQVGWQSCSISPGAITNVLSSSDGAKILYVFSKDEYGNVSNSTTVSLVLDQTPPALNLTTFTGGGVINGNNAQSVSWTTSDSGSGLVPNSVEIDLSSDGGSTWVPLASAQSNTSPFAWTPGVSINGTHFRVRISIFDAAGNSASATSASDIIISSVAPVLQSGNMTVNGAASGGITTNPNVTVSLMGQSSTNNISQFCLKYNTLITPLTSDSCWVSVNASPPGLTPSPTLTLTNYNFSVGLTTGTYVISAWLKDSVGHISTLIASGAGVLGTDTASISFNQLTPPTVIDVVAANSAAPNYPNPTAGDLSIPAATNTYIQWNVSVATNGLGATPISLFYTINNSSYTLIANNLVNGANGCVPDAHHSGCYLWSSGAPSSSYFAVKALVTDIPGLNASAIGPGVNVSANLLYLAGNTDPGTNGSANSSSFVNYGGSTEDPQSFVVSSNGIIYFRDRYRGILKVDPATGSQSILFPLTGTNYVDGAVGTATVNSPIALTLDAQDRLYIYDVKGIRRYDSTLNSLTTLIGGLAASNTGDTTAALTTKLTITGSWGSDHFPFFVDPLNEVVFSSEYGSNVPSLRMRIYSPTSGNVTSVYPNGTGTSCNPTQALSTYSINLLYSGFALGGTVDTLALNFCYAGGCACSANFNSSTGAVIPSIYPAPTYMPSIGNVVGLDGNAYFFSPPQGVIKLYNKTTYAWTTVVGNGIDGHVADGTTSNSAISPTDVFVNSAGKIYFFERGMIRFVDQNGKLQTIAGVSRSFGDGGSALSARIGNVTDFKLWNDGTNDYLIFSDASELKFRQFVIGGNISTFIGNGSSGVPNTTSLASGQPINYASFGSQAWLAFQVDASNGTVYSNGRGDYISQVLQSTDHWVDLVGGGGTPYESADGLSGNQVNINGYWPAILGFDGANLLTGLFRYVATYYDSFLKIYSVTSPSTQTSLAGVSGVSGNLCSVGTTLTSCMIPASGYTGTSFNDMIWDAYGSQWVAMMMSSAVVYSIVSGGTLQYIATLPHIPYGFDFVHDAGQEMVYYCSSSDSKMHKYNVLTSTDTTYSWPVTGMTCGSHSVIYSASRNSLIFAYSLNGLMGFAEIPNP